MRTLFCFSCLVLVLAGCRGGTPGSSNDVEGGTPAADLSAEFLKDPQAADKKYKDKTITLTAIVDAVNSNEETGKGVIVLLKGLRKDNPADDGPNFECVIASASESKALALIETQKVKLTGKYKKVEGKEAAMPNSRDCIYLEDCTIDVVGPDPSVPVTAVELARSFATDEDAARNKYLDKMVLVEGKFIRSDAAQYLGTVCFLEGHEKDGKSFPVVVITDPEKLGNPEQGATLKLRALCMGQGVVNGNSCVRLFGAKLAK
jgi:hypothetical protein